MWNVLVFSGVVVVLFYRSHKYFSFLFLAFWLNAELATLLFIFTPREYRRNKAWNYITKHWNVH